MPKEIDSTSMIGKRFGSYTVLAYDGYRVTSKSRQKMWLCVCDCGTERSVSQGNLKNGNSKSCGCWKADHAREWKLTHGMTGTPEYNTWKQMIKRCYNKKARNYRWYGAVGISVCDSWRTDFLAFFNHVGQKPYKAHSIDRYPNRNGNYDPGNVRWATQDQQVDNRDVVVFIEHNGMSMTATQWAKHYGISAQSIRYRYKRGLPMEEVFSVVNLKTLRRSS